MESSDELNGEIAEKTGESAEAMKAGVLRRERRLCIGDAGEKRGTLEKEKAATEALVNRDNEGAKSEK